jgi:2-polyprenyl-6-methoxyphenol hydroxylase-like FAD-dependent oxidoreductase
MHDAIVIGARCAGATTAMQLARAGLDVLLVDRASFPSDTLSTHFIHPRGGAKLQAWGLLDELRATGVPPISTTRFDIGPAAITGRAEPVDGVTDWFCPRRTILDKLLVDAAANAGCEMRTDTALVELLWDDDRVTGVRLRSGTRSMNEHARIVVGADGMRSTVARLVEAPTYREVPPMIGVFYTYWSGFDTPTAQFHVREGRHVLAFPTHDDLTCIFVAWHADEFDTYRSDVDANYRRTLDLAPGLAEQVRSGVQAAPYRGTNNLPNFYRRPFGPGWALVGDAGHHKDPTTGMGISDAFRDADLLATAVTEAMSGATTFAVALADYQRARDEASGSIWDWTMFAAALPDPSGLRPYVEAIADDPVECTRLLSVIGGTRHFLDVFGAEHQREILAVS